MICAKNNCKWWIQLPAKSRGHQKSHNITQVHGMNENEQKWISRFLELHTSNTRSNVIQHGDISSNMIVPKTCIFLWLYRPRPAVFHYYMFTESIVENKNCEFQYFNRFCTTVWKTESGFHSKNLDTRMDYYGWIGNTFTSILDMQWFPTSEHF